MKNNTYPIFSVSFGTMRQICASPLPSEKGIRGKEWMKKRCSVFCEIFCYSINNFIEIQWMEYLCHLCKKEAREVMKMAYEILKSIVETEAQAAEIKRQAAEAAEQQKADALKQRDALLEQTKRRGQEEMRQAVQASEADGRQAVQQILQEAEKACAAIRAQASQKKEDAVEAVIRKVVGEYGSC